MTAESIQLGDRTLPIGAIPIGRIKKLMAAFYRVGVAIEAAVFDESVLDDMVLCISAATDVPVDELEQLSTTAEQLCAAFETIAEVSGLERMLRRAREIALGEARPGQSPASTSGTSSTPASSLPPAGPGTTSTPA